jgi:hypothetical protein
MGYLWEYPKVLCPENCRYRSKSAPVCGYCLPKIMKELGLRKDKDEVYGQNETEDNGQAGSEGL